MNETQMDDEYIPEEEPEPVAATAMATDCASIEAVTSTALTNALNELAASKNDVVVDNDGEVINVVNDESDDVDVVSSPITEDGVDELPIDEVDPHQKLLDEVTLNNETVPNKVDDDDIERSNGLHQVVYSVEERFVFIVNHFFFFECLCVTACDFHFCGQLFSLYIFSINNNHLIHTFYNWLHYDVIYHLINV